MRASQWARNRVRSYFESQLPDDPVVHLEKVASERVGSVLHEIWDVHCTDSRWWAVTNPLNYYSQDDFKSRDVVLTFHVGLSLRLASQRDVPITDSRQTAPAAARSARRYAPCSASCRRYPVKGGEFP